MELLLLHGDLVFALVALATALVAGALVSRGARRAGLADHAMIRAGMIAGGSTWSVGERVTLRGRLRVDSPAVARYVDGSACGVTTLVGDPDRRLAGRPDRGGLRARAERLSVEVKGPDGAPLRVALDGPIDVLVGAVEHRSAGRLGRRRGLRRRVVDAYPIDGPQRDLDFVVERSLGDDDPAAITGFLRREADGASSLWSLGARAEQAPFRRDDAGDAPSAGDALIAAFEGPPRRIATDRRRHLLAATLSVAALVLGLHGAARAVGVRPRPFVAREVAPLTDALRTRALVGGLSPIDRADAIFPLARAVEYRPGADASSFAEAMALYEAAGGCRLAVAAAASAHPEEAAARAERCPGARGEAIALYQLGRFEEAARAIAGRVGDAPAFVGEDRWLVEALLLGDADDAAAAVIRRGWAGSGPPTLAEVLDDPAAYERALEHLRSSPRAARDDAVALLERADRLDPAERFALLDAIEAYDLPSEREVLLWWLLRVEVRPEAGWRPPPSPIVAPRLKLAEPAEGDPPGDLFEALKAPPYVSIDPLAHLDSVQPLPDLPWGVVFSIARQLEHRRLESDEGRINRARVSHAAGVFELLAGEYVEAERWFAVAYAECSDSYWPRHRGDLEAMCRDLEADRVIAALFAGDRPLARKRGDALARGHTRYPRLLQAIALAHGEGRGAAAPISTWFAREQGDDGAWIAAELVEARRREHPAIRLFATPTLSDRDELVRHLLWQTPSGACIPSIGETLLPEVVARAASLDALGEHAAADGLRARADRLRERLQLRDGAVVLWLARVRQACINNPGGDPRLTG